jgi:uncharacterized membrane protein
MAAGCFAAYRTGELPAALSASILTSLFLLAAGAGHFLGSDNVPNHGVPDLTRDTVTCAIAALPPADLLHIITEEWKQITTVQMHFNEMIIRMRTLAVSVVISVFGGAGFVVARYRDQFIKLEGRSFHISVFVAAAGLLLWLTIFIVDYCYYYKLLLGAVRRGYEIDKAFSASPAFGTLHLFGAARLISAAIGPSGASEYIIWVYYGLVYFAGVAFLTTVMIVI